MKVTTVTTVFCSTQVLTEEQFSRRNNSWWLRLLCFKQYLRRSEKGMERCWKW